MCCFPTSSGPFYFRTESAMHCFTYTDLNLISLISHELRYSSYETIGCVTFKSAYHLLLCFLLKCDGVTTIVIPDHWMVLSFFGAGPNSMHVICPVPSVTERK